MDAKHLLLIIFALNCIATSLVSIENDIRIVNVLAALFPPFTYIDSNNQIFDGIDVQILKSIAKRLDLKFNLVRADNITNNFEAELE